MDIIVEPDLYQASRAMAFGEAARVAASKDVIFFHVDGGSFSPHRFNPDLMRVERWASDLNKWVPLSESESSATCRDWTVSKLARKDCETIEYE